jgi:hypothetical protein
MNASARASVRRDAVALACLVAATGVAGQLSKAAPAPGRGLAARSEIAGPCDGSSNPTFLSNNRRLATTAGRRVLALYDPHGSGQQLVWRDRGRGWSTRTRGAVADGFMPGDRGGDRPASIALARDAAGRQHAWVVWGGHDFGHLLSVEMRRLSQLDRAGGPRVGPELTIARAGNRGHARPTIAFERGRRGPKGVVAWLGRAESSYDLVVQWFTNLNDDTPRMHHRTVLFSSGRASPTPTLVAGRRGTRLVTTTPAGRLAVFAHSAAHQVVATTPTQPGLSRIATMPGTAWAASRSTPTRRRPRGALRTAA